MERIYRDYYDNLVSLVTLRQNSCNNAEDAVQQVFTELLQNLPKEFTDENHLQRYIERAAVNRSIDAYRRKNKRTKEELCGFNAILDMSQDERIAKVLVGNIGVSTIEDDYSEESYP